MAAAEAIAAPAPPSRQVAPLTKYRPHKKQRAFHALRRFSPARFVGVKAGRRGGKTISASAEFVIRTTADLADRQAGRGRFEHFGPGKFAGWKGSDPDPLLHYWVIAPTHELVGEPAKYLQRFFGLAKDGGLILDQDRSRGIWRLRGGIRVDFRTAERPELLVSRGLDGIWGDEAARWKKDVWAENALPTLADRQGWGMLTTTPLGRNWFWREVWALADPVEAAIAKDQGVLSGELDPAYAAIQWYTVDNTALPRLAEEVEAARGRMPDALWRRSFKADFSAFAGQIFDLDRSKHLLAGVHWLPTSFDLGVVAGYDHGWTHPGVLTVWGIRSSRPHFVELETVSLKRTPISSQDGDGWASIAQRLRKRWRFSEVFVPQDAKEAATQFRRAGLRVRSAYQDRLAGLQWFQCGLHDAEIALSSPAVFARFESLVHPAGFGKESELWVKEDDDEFDAARYALTDWIRQGRLPGAQRVRLVESILRR